VTSPPHDVEEPFAWQPLTPPGVAAFARTSIGRLLLVQFIFALLTGSCVAWFIGSAWFPVITQAVERLPDAGEIRSGLLTWPGESPALLGRNRFLAIGVDLRQQHGLLAPAHVHAQFSQTHLRLHSLLGYAQWAYPQDYLISLSRAEVAPRWGAWKPVLLAGVVAAVSLGLLVTWSILALLYVLPIWVLGFYANRNLDLPSAWRLCGASLMPGAVIMCVAIVGYGAGLWNLPELGAAFILHVLVGWLFAVVSPSCLEPIPEIKDTPKNPFQKTIGAEPNADEKQEQR
jgi:hypothetical protein